MVTVYRNRSALTCVVEAVPVVSPKMTIAEVEVMLRRHSKDYSSIAYVYLVDADRTLFGVVSIKEIFLHTPQTVVAAVAKSSLVYATSNMDCEAIAILAWHHNLKAVPVVDETTKRFIGVVTPDKLMDILHQGRTLDALRHAGMQPLPGNPGDFLAGTPLMHIKKRLPWLLVGLVGGVVAAMVVKLFESELAAEVLIVAFIPLVVYLADAVGSQTEIIFVRAVALDRDLATWERFRQYFVREMIVTGVLAAILSAIIAVVCLFWFGAPDLVWLLVTAVMTTLIAAVLVALWIPYIATRLKFDPALTSGPVATVIRDVLTLVIYFMVVWAFLQI